MEIKRYTYFRVFCFRRDIFLIYIFQNFLQEIPLSNRFPFVSLCLLKPPERPPNRGRSLEKKKLGKKAEKRKHLK